MRKINFLFLFIILLFVFIGVQNIESLQVKNSFAADLSFLEKQSDIINKGVWVSVFSEKKVLYSKEAALKLIDTCKKYNLNEIYLQIYRAGIAYYDSKILDRKQYEQILQSFGADPIDFLIDEALRSGIKVFAWVNVLSLSQNKDADIVKKLGDSILTRDQYLRLSLKGDGDNQTDKYYLREDQLFLEPGDPLVQDYILSVVKEISKRYTKLSGVHLDYIRYPYPVPYNPSSKFGNYGLNYGYGQSCVAKFKEATGINALALKNSNEFAAWDDWRRAQVTNIVKKISSFLKSNFPEMLLSSAVMPSSERAYTVLFQDWPLWLEQGIVDYVVLMNYTKDNQLAKVNLSSALCLRGEGNVYNGVGVFLMNDDLSNCSKQLDIINSLNPDGVVFFSYDDLS